MKNRVTELFGIELPIIQGGMVWCSSWRLAAAVSNAGGLGLIGAGSMHPDTFREHIQKCKAATSKPFGVNLPLMQPQVEELVEILIEEGVKIVFTSAGSPKKFTARLQSLGIVVTHVISNSKFALKCEEAGVDAIVAEGFEAGGHNGAEETTTMALIPHIKSITSLPLIAAGGIATGGGILAALALGADAVQIGTLFATAEESSAHANFKQIMVSAKDGETLLSLKSVGPTRIFKNSFYTGVKELETSCATAEEIKQYLGRGRAKKGMFEGNVDDGEIEFGQIAAVISKVDSVATIINRLKIEYNIAKEQITNL